MARGRRYSSRVRASEPSVGSAVFSVRGMVAVWRKVSLTVCAHVHEYVCVERLGLGLGFQAAWLPHYLSVSATEGGWIARGGSGGLDGWQAGRHARVPQARRG